MPRLSIIIPTYQEEGFIERTLAQFKGLSIPHELIVTDGGSTDKTLEIAHRYTDKVAVWDRAAKGRRQTIGEARNLGAALASGEYYVFIDADVTVPRPEEFFTIALRYLEAHPRAVALTAPFAPEQPRIADSLGIWPVNAWFYLCNNVLRIGQASGEFQLVRAAAFEALGGYREDLAAVEDVDFFGRAAKIGRTVSMWNLRVQHSFRRIHKLGWTRTYWLWISNGLHYQLFNKAAVKEWEVVR